MSCDNRYTVWVVDGSEENHILYQRLLRAEGQTTYDLSCFSQGAIALEWWTQACPDVMLLADQLPDGEGLQVLSQLRQHDDAVKLPVILVSAQADESLAIQAMQQGAQDYLVKEELTPGRLQRTIRLVLARSQRLQRDIQALKAAQEQRSGSLHNQAELSLKESQHFIQRIAEASPNIIFVYDVQEQRNIYANREIITVLGYSAEEIQALGSSFVPTLVHPEDLLDVPAYIERVKAAQDGELLENEYRMQHANGDWRWIYTREVVFSRDEAGRVKQTIGMAQDISDRKQAEAQLQSLSGRLALALQSGAIGTWDWDLIHEATWDERMYEIYGLQDLDRPANYQDWQARLHPEDLALAEAALQAAVQGDRPFDVEFRIYWPDGSLRWIKALALVQRNAQGQPLRMTGINYDITAQKQIEANLIETNQQLARATQLKDEFLANMSHELRTPLNAILGMAEALQDQTYGSLNDKQLKALQTIEQSGFHLLDLINDILDVAKIESGQLTLDRQPTAIAPLCQSSLALIQQQAFKKQITLHQRLPSALPNLLMDERRMRQVLINLLNNAVKFTPEGGQITLEVQFPLPQTSDNDWRYLRIAVTDTGIGIAPENLPKLFQPFIQIDSALNRQYTGTGLGLALVKRLVELHGGQVDVTSEIGVGSCFTVDLPCLLSSPLDSGLPTQPEQSCEPVSLAPTAFPIILLAEDNEANIETLANYLQAKGYRLRLAKTGQAAVEMSQTVVPDLIVMDIQMPGMDGLEAIRRIRYDPYLSDVPIIALTALAMPGDRDRCLAAGASGYLTKPVRMKQLVLTIEQFLGRSQSSVSRHFNGGEV